MRGIDRERSSNSNSTDSKQATNSHTQACDSLESNAVEHATRIFTKRRPLNEIATHRIDSHVSDLKAGHGFRISSNGTTPNRKRTFGPQLYYWLDQWAILIHHDGNALNVAIQLFKERAQKDSLQPRHSADTHRRYRLCPLSEFDILLFRYIRVVEMIHGTQRNVANRAECSSTRQIGDSLPCTAALRIYEVGGMKFIHSNFHEQLSDYPECHFVVARRHHDRTEHTRFVDKRSHWRAGNVGVITEHERLAG